MRSFCLTIFLLFGDVKGFAPFSPTTQSLILSARQTPTSNLRLSGGQDKNKAIDFYYNDDAFGLIFLSGLLIDEDYNFCAIFAGLSAVAATVATKQKSSEPMVPGIVALAALGTTEILHPPVSLLEIGVCLASLGYSVFQQQNFHKLDQ